MKYCVFFLILISFFSCSVGKTLSIDQLAIAPVLIESKDEDAVDRLDLLKETGFNTALFIGADPSAWSALTIQARGRDMYAVFMTDITDAALLRDHILDSGVKAGIDGIWLRKGEDFSKKDLSVLQSALQKMKRSITDRSVLGKIFVQSSTADMMSLLRGGNLVPGPIYFDHTAAGLLGLAAHMGAEENPVSGIGSDIAKMYNWRNFYKKSADLMVPLANNFSYAFTDPKIFSLITAVMTSLSGPLYLPIALTPSDRIFYSADIDLVKQYLELRRNHPSLYEGKHSNLAYSSGVYVDMKEKGRERLVLVCNFNNQPLQYRLPYLDKFNIRGKRIESLLSGRGSTLTGNELLFSLAPYEVDFWLIH